MSVIASASKDLKFHQCPDGTFQQSYLPKSHDGYIQSISWGKDGSWVILVPDSGPAEIISIKDNVKLLQTIQDVYRPSCASFHTGTKKLIGIGTMCGQVMIYDIKGKNIKKRFPRASSKICSLRYNNKDSHIAATCNNGEILLLSYTTCNISTVYKVPNSSSVTSSNFHCIRRNLFTAGSDIGIVAVWDINNNSMLCKIQAHQAPVSSLAFSPLHGELLVTGGLDRKFSFYDLSVMKPLIEVEVDNAVTALDFSSCGTYLGIGFQNGNIAIYDARKNYTNPLTVFEVHQGCGTYHLQFQKICSTSNQNSIFNITIEEASYDHQENHLTYSASGFECDNITTDDSNTDSRGVYVSKRTLEAGDSFLMAMGLDASNQTASTKQDSSTGMELIEDGVKLPDSLKHYSNTKRFSGQRNSLLLAKSGIINSASTPKYVDTEPPDTVESPILYDATYKNYVTNPKIQNSNPQCTQNCINPSDLQVMIKDIVQKEVRDIIHEEVKHQTELLRSSIKTDITDMLGQVRRYFLDLQLSVIKEFVNMEALLEKRTSTEFLCGELLLNQQEMNLKENIIERDDCHSRKF